MKFIINGGRKLSGEIKVNGAKNLAVKAQAASILFSPQLAINNVPLIEDVFRMNELLADIGVKIKNSGSKKFILNTEGLANRHRIREDIAKRLRSSIVLAGPILARMKKVYFPYPGGCVIGKRPIDIFLKGWKAFGAKIYETIDGYKMSASRLKGIDFTFKTVSVTGTETIMMTAVLAEGRTILRNAAREPEIQALAEFLNGSGAKIKGAGTSTIEIIGTKGNLLNSQGKTFTIIPDRIEAGSFLIIGALLGRDLRIKNCVPEHISVFIESLKDAGVPIKIFGRDIVVSRPNKILPVDITTREYPGFPTDLQAPFVVFLTQARGRSIVFETIFDKRLNYIEDLNRAGADIIMCDPHRIIINGPSKLRGREIESPDLRAGLAFIISGMVAKGKSIIDNVYQIDRGYEKIDERLNSIGASIKRVQ